MTSHVRTPVREVFARVVDHVVGTHRTDQIRLLPAAHAGDPRAERLRDLHGQRAHAPGRSDDEHRLTRLHVRVIADRLERGAARHRNGRGLLERDVGRLAHELVGGAGRELGERALHEAHDLVAGTQFLDVDADGLDTPRDVPPSWRLQSFVDVGAHTSQVRLALHQVPHVGTATGRLHLHEHVVVPDHRVWHVPKLEHIRRSEPVLHDRLHGQPPWTRCTAYTDLFNLRVRRTPVKPVRPRTLRVRR